MSQNKLSHGISGASIQFWAQQDNGHRRNISKKLLKYSDPWKRISSSLDINKSLEIILFLVEQVPSKYISLY